MGVFTTGHAHKKEVKSDYQRMAHGKKPANADSNKNFSTHTKGQWKEKTVGQEMSDNEKEQRARANRNDKYEGRHHTK